MQKGLTGAFRLRTENSNMSLACAMTHDLEILDDCRASRLLPAYAIKKDDLLEVHCEAELIQDSTLVLRKYLSYVDASAAAKPLNTLLPLAVDLAEQARLDGFSTLCREQENYLQNFWQHAQVVIDGDPAALEGLRLNMNICCNL